MLPGQDWKRFFLRAITCMVFVGSVQWKLSLNCFDVRVLIAHFCTFFLPVRIPDMGNLRHSEKSGLGVLTSKGPGRPEGLNESCDLWPLQARLGQGNAAKTCPKPSKTHQVSRPPESVGEVVGWRQANDVVVEFEPWNEMIRLTMMDWHPFGIYFLVCIVKGSLLTLASHRSLCGTEVAAQTSESVNWMEIPTSIMKDIVNECHTLWERVGKSRLTRFKVLVFADHACATAQLRRQMFS